MPGEASQGLNLPLNPVSSGNIAAQFFSWGYLRDPELSRGKGQTKPKGYVPPDRVLCYTSVGLGATLYMWQGSSQPLATSMTG